MKLANKSLLLPTATILLLNLMPQLAAAFALMVSPPRFELQSKPGKTIREIIEIENVSNSTQNLSIQTNDWQLDSQGSVLFEEALAADSCRPWVALEAKKLTVQPSASKRFRFEIQIPENTTDRECRFAIMLEGEPQVNRGQVPLPVTGRVGVIVYLRLGNAAPALSITKAQQMTNANGSKNLALEINNTGNAHGRLEGYIKATDNTGKVWQLSPSADPVIPGKPRVIALIAQDDYQPNMSGMQLPIKLKGTLEYEGGKINVETDINHP